MVQLNKITPCTFQSQTHMANSVIKYLEKQIQLMVFWQFGAISHWHWGHQRLMFNCLTFKGHYALSLYSLSHRHECIYQCASTYTCAITGFQLDCVFVCVNQECEFCRRGGPEEDERVRGPDRRSALRHPDRFREQRDWQQGKSHTYTPVSSCYRHKLWQSSAHTWTQNHLKENTCTYTFQIILLNSTVGVCLHVGVLITVQNVTY